MTLRAMLVDDEEPARDRLRAMLERFEDLEVVAEARDGAEAVDKIAAARPDLVFLDIEMPGLNGMQVAAALAPPRPRIIFCTAYDQYAIEAFEQHATDYLLKPVAAKRLDVAIRRVREALGPGRALDREVVDATRTQARLLPQQLTPMEHLDYAGICRPARGVGGDYYDFLGIGEALLGIAVGDVSGKGIFAGLLMAKLQATLQSLAPDRGAALDRLLDETNRMMHAATDLNRYASLFYALYDDAERSLTWVNAGHNPPLLLRAADTRRLEPNGTVIGLMADAKYRPETLRLEAGDLLVLFTDGVTEALGPGGEEFGEQRLRQQLSRRSDLPAAELCAAILAAVDEFARGEPQHDDMTVVVARVR